MAQLKVSSAQGRCDVCQTVGQVKTITEGKREVAICESCGSKMAATLGDLLLKYGRDLGNVETSIDKFLGLVKEKKKVSLDEAAVALREKQSTIEKWAEILDKKGLVKLVYPENPFDKAYVEAK